MPRRVHAMRPYGRSSCVGLDRLTASMVRRLPIGKRSFPRQAEESQRLATHQSAAARAENGARVGRVPLPLHGVAEFDAKATDDPVQK